MISVVGVGAVVIMIVAGIGSLLMIVFSLLMIAICFVAGWC